MVLNILIFLIVLGILIIAHELGHFLVAKKCGVRVEAFSIGFGPCLFKKKIGDTEYRLSVIPVGGYVKLAGETNIEETTGADWEFMSKPIWKRFFILASGSIFNYILAIFVAIVLFNIGMPRMNTEVGEVIENYPAYEAGIKESDIITAIEGVKVEYWTQMVEYIRRYTDQTINIELQRPQVGKLNVDLNPRIEKRENIYGEEVEVSVIGVYPSGQMILLKYSFFRSVSEGIKYIGLLTVATIRGIWNMIIGNITFKEAATGPVGIYHITAHAAKEGILFLLNIIAVISMSLGLINLFPFPVLDGGHILFLFIEKIKGSPLSSKTQQILMQIGMYVLIALMLYLIYIDFLRFK